MNNIYHSVENARFSEHNVLRTGRVTSGNPFSALEPDQLNGTCIVLKISNKPFSGPMSFSVIPFYYPFNLYERKVGIKFRYFVELGPVDIFDTENNKEDPGMY